MNRRNQATEPAVDAIWARSGGSHRAGRRAEWERDRARGKEFPATRSRSQLPVGGGGGESGNQKSVEAEKRNVRGSPHEPLPMAAERKYSLSKRLSMFSWKLVFRLKIFREYPKNAL